MLRLSIIQPGIVRGDIDHNVGAIQRLIDASEGDLLVLPEYALTGSLVLDDHASAREWARRSAAAIASLSIPPGRHVLINALTEANGQLRNCCRLLPAAQHQCKLRLDEAERKVGVEPGRGWHVFELHGLRFMAAICSDIHVIDQALDAGLDFLLWVFHLTPANLAPAMADAKTLSSARGLRIFVCSLVSDRNIGHSAYIDGRMRLALRNREGILEVVLA